MVRDYSGIVKALMGEWEKTSQPLKERASILPLGAYEDGSVHLAWPSLLAAPFEGMANFGRYGYDTPESVADNARSAFDIAGGAMTGSLATGLAGGMVDNAARVASGPTRLTPMEQAIADLRKAVADSEAKLSAAQPPRAKVVPGYGYVDQSALMRDEVPIQSYLTTDLAGAVGEGDPLMADMSQMYRLRRERSESPFDLREPDPSIFTASEVPGMAALRGAERLASPDGISLDYTNILNALERPTYLNANAKPGASIPLAVQSAERQGAKTEASGAMTGGLATGLAGGMVDNALGSAGGKLTLGAPFTTAKGNKIVEILRDDKPVGRVNYYRNEDGVQVDHIAVDDGSNSLGLSGINELREAFRAIEPGATRFFGDRAYDLKTGRAAEGAKKTGRGGRAQSVDIAANAPTGAALPLAAEAQDIDPNDPVLLDVLRQYGMIQ